MYIRINRRRLKLHPTSSEHEIFDLVSSKLVWPKQRAYLEWADGHVVEIRDDGELRLASRILSEFLYSEIKDWIKDFQHTEAKINAHMEEPDSDIEDRVVSDDDMTIDDFYMMGFRHEICN